MIEYHVYTVKDVREWLYNNAQNGLSEQIIAKTRADSIIHCPCVTDDSVIVVSAIDGDRVVGYTAMFPEHWIKPDIWTSNATTLYANPKYAGDFIGYYVTKRLLEVAPNRYLIGTDSAPESVLIDKLLGAKSDFFIRKRFILDRKISIHSMRNLATFVVEPLRKGIQHIALKREFRRIPSSAQVEYVNFIDWEAYQFIRLHSDNDIFLRSQEMLNWILHYPFRFDASQTTRRRVDECQFSSQVDNFKRCLVKVYDEGNIIGLYMLIQQNYNVRIVLLYNEKEKQNVVYRILLERVVRQRAHVLHSQYVGFNKYMENAGVSLKCYDDKFSFTYPKDMPIDISKQLQGADGDMFA